MIGDSSIPTNEIETFWSGPVRLVDGVVHLFDHDRQGQLKIEATRGCRLFPFVVALVLSQEHIVGDVTLHLPAIRRVRFLHIHHQEGHLRPVALVHGF